MFSPSEPPATLGNIAIGLPVLFILCALSLTLWLLPGCAVARFIASSRGVRGIGAAIIIGVLAAIIAFGTIYFVPSLFDWPPTRPQVLRKLPVALLGAAFVLTWFLGFELLPPRPEATRAEGTGTAHRVPLPRLAIRITAETLAVVAVIAYAAILGGIAGTLLDLGGDEEYRVKSVYPSPRGGLKAYTVLDYTSGGALGDLYEEVYVLPASETWTPAHRGLLLWHAEHVEAVEVGWTSERGIRVKVGASDFQEHAERVRVYPRSGYQVSTEPTAKP